MVAVVCSPFFFFKYFHAEFGIISNGYESIFDSLILNACIGVINIQKCISLELNGGEEITSQKTKIQIQK